MPPTSDQASRKPLSFAGLPDRDNPLAWKRKTREGKRGARELLSALTDEEVARYMTVALDQVHLEERLWALKVMCAVAGAAIVGVLAMLGFATQFTGWAIAGLLLGLTMVYWPWRVLRCRQLWQKHFEAAQAEQFRRNGLV